MSNTSTQNRKWIIAITLLGLILRILFLIKGASIFYGAGQEHLNGDSSSYTKSFINLITVGNYTFEPLIPEASFGRLPGYPFFYGIHYLLFGSELAPFALSVSQMLLDTSVIVIIYNMLYRWTKSINSARIGAILYAVYPFAIIWITIIGTESLNNFVTIAWLSVITKQTSNKFQYFSIGVIAALAFYIREYMGILLPISVLYIWLRTNSSTVFHFQQMLLIVLGFGCMYFWWPVRNYINHDKIVLVKPASAGYANLREDMQSYLAWLHTWTNDNTTWVDKVIQNRTIDYPSDIFKDSIEQRRAYILTKQAALCGSSFYLRRLNSQDYRLSSPAIFNNCNLQVAAGFDSLRSSYIQRSPVRYMTVVPFDNIYKAFFKSATIKNNNSTVKVMIQRVLFGYRTLLLLVGVLAVWVGRSKQVFWPIAFYFIFIYIFISFEFRSLEMRYLLQADVLMLLPAAWLISKILNHNSIKTIN